MKLLVFTSAGDNSTFNIDWYDKNKKFDIITYYYMDNQEIFNKYKKISKFIIKRKGSKFQNLLHFFNNYKDLFDSYDYFFILDDDLVFENGYKDIERMFNLTIEYKLDLSSPCFYKDSIVSHEITRKEPNIFLDYTNFVEVTCPLVKKESLTKFLNVLDEKLIGWGIDFLLSQIICTNNNTGIFHCINCLNPTLHSKNIKLRENTLVKNFSNEDKYWYNYCDERQFKKRINIHSYKKIRGFNIKYTFLYINLKKHSNRNNHIINEFKKYKITNYKRIEGINGNNIEELKKYCVFSENLISKYSKSEKWTNKYLSNGEMGCFLSHLISLEYFVNNLDDDYCFICEDDFSFDTVDYLDDNIDNIINDLKTKKNEFFNLAPIFPKDLRKINNIHQFNTYFNNFWGTSCLLISKKEAKKILKFYKFKNRLVNFDIHTLPYDESINLQFNITTFPLFVNKIFESSITNNISHNNFHKENRKYILDLWNFEKKENNIEEINLFHFLKGFKNDKIIFIPTKGDLDNYILNYSIINIFNVLELTYVIENGDNIFKNEILIYGGGSCFKNNNKMNKKSIINNYINNKIIILPQTIINTDIFDNIDCEYLSNITIFCRELQSYNYLNNIKINNPNFYNIYLCRDLSFFITIHDYYLDYKNDKEKVLICFENKNVKDNNNFPFITKPKGQRIITKEKIEYFYFKMINTINNYTIIKTDRILVAILGALLNKKIYLYKCDDNIHVYDYSLKKYINIQLFDIINF
jgi:GR25 family glycosyltransferase involved in LPS biosynthesis